MNIVSGFADISVAQLLLVAGVALFASVIGGLAGYGTGALMPLVLVPLIGAEPVVPIIAISSIFTNLSRFVAYIRYADRRRALIVVVGRDPHHRARRLRLHAAERCRRGARDRQHADPERAAAPPGQAPR